MVETLEQYEWTSYNSFIGNTKAPSWLRQQFILDYFGQTLSIAQSGYRTFVGQYVDKDYESPLKDVFGSFLLGSQTFIDFVKDEYLYNQKPTRSAPAIRQLAGRILMTDVCEVVESEFNGSLRLAKKIKIYLIRKNTAENLKSIGKKFRIGDSAVSQSYSRFAKEIKANRDLRRQAGEIEKLLGM